MKQYTKNEMWDCYNAIIKALSNHIIEVSHDSSFNSLTTFYFKDCCGGDIVREALEYLNNKK